MLTVFIDALGFPVTFHPKYKISRRKKEESAQEGVSFLRLKIGISNAPYPSGEGSVRVDIHAEIQKR